jgi:hypothetical protein
VGVQQPFCATSRSTSSNPASSWVSGGIGKVGSLGRRAGASIEGGSAVCSSDGGLKVEMEDNLKMEDEASEQAKQERSFEDGAARRLR